MLIDKKSLKVVSPEELSGRLALVEVLDITIEDLKTKCREEDVASCLGGVLVVFTKDVDVAKSPGCEVLDVLELGEEYAVVTRATPECASRLVKSASVSKIEKSREVVAL